MELYGYTIVERGRGAYSTDGTDNYSKWSPLSYWHNFNKKLYLTIESANEALETLQKLPMYNNQYRITEFKIVPLYIKKSLNEIEE